MPSGYLRLHKASAADRQAFVFIGEGHGVHWEALDEDLSAKGIASAPRRWNADR